MLTVFERTNHNQGLCLLRTRISAIAEDDVMHCHLKCCLLLYNCTKNIICKHMQYMSDLEDHSTSS